MPGDEPLNGGGEAVAFIQGRGDNVLSRVPHEMQEKFCVFGLCLSRGNRRHMVTALRAPELDSVLPSGQRRLRDF